MFYLHNAWHKARRLRAVLVAGLFIACLTGVIGSLIAGAAQVRSTTLRLHILANSDSAADQALKLDVRDAILRQAGTVLGAAQTKEQALEQARQALPAIQQAASREIARQGYDYSVCVQLENTFFGTRPYDGFTLPAGQYDAVRVVIGEGAGHNWFCVLFPPLCVPAAMGQADGKDYEGQAKETVESPYRISFALVEAAERVRQWLED